MTGYNRNALVALSLGFGLLAVGALSHWLRLPLSAYVAGLCLGVGGSRLLLALLFWLSRGSMGDSTRPALARRYHRGFGMPMGLYVVVMLFWKYLLVHVDPNRARVLIALLPAILVALVIRAVARYVCDSDRCSDGSNWSRSPLPPAWSKVPT